MKLARYYKCRGCATMLVSILKPMKGWPEQCPGCRGIPTFLFEEDITDAEYARIAQKGGKEARIAPSQAPRPWACRHCQQLQPGEQKPIYHLGRPFCTAECKDAYTEAHPETKPYRNDKERREALRQLEREQEALMLGTTQESK